MIGCGHIFLYIMVVLHYFFENLLLYTRGYISDNLSIMYNCKFCAPGAGVPVLGHGPFGVKVKKHYFFEKSSPGH